MVTDPSQFRILRLAPGESAAAWTGALAAFDAGTAKILKEEGGSTVYRTQLLGRNVVVKVRKLMGLRECLKLWTSKTRGIRHWNGAEWLTSHGFATAKPHALAIESRADATREWLVLEMVPGKTLLQHIADRDLSVRQEHGVARRLGRQIEAMARSGRYNRDHKPSNLILVPGPDGFSPVIIDCVAIRPGRHMFWRMLHALAVEPLGVGIMPRRALRARVVNEFLKAEMEADPVFLSDPVARRRQERVYWQIVTGSLKDHGDPTPRTNPLSSPPPSR